MNNSQIESFLISAQTLSFTEAAERLYLTQQAVSRNIINLEKELGVTFFARDSRRLCLTPAGEYYYSFFMNANLDFKSVSSEVAEAYAHLSHKFSIDYSMWIDPLGQIDVGVSSFRAKFPKTRFSGRQYHNDELFSELSGGSLDVVLMSEAQISRLNQFEKSPIAYEDICLYAPAYVEGDSPEKKMWNLPILFNASWEWTYFEWQQMIVKEKHNLNIESDRIISLPNMQSIFAELAIGDCVIISDNNFGNASSYKNMRRFHIDSSSCVFCLWERCNENPLIGEFVSHMREAFGYTDAQQN